MGLQVIAMVAQVVALVFFIRAIRKLHSAIEIYQDALRVAVREAAELASIEPGRNPRQVGNGATWS